MARKILIIDKFSPTRALIRSYLKAELGDVEIHESTFLDHALQELEQHEIHLIITNDRLPGIERMLLPGGKKSSQDQVSVNIPILLMMVNAGTSSRIHRFREQGFEFFLASPFDAEELAATINGIVEPSALRLHPRHHVPEAEAVIHLADRDLSSRLINFSRNGLLCETTAPSESLPSLDFSRIKVSLRFPPELNNLRVDALPCRLVGCKVLQWDEDHNPERVRIEWNILEELPNMSILEEALKDWKEALAASIDN